MDDKAVALVTGAGAGLGAAIAVQLAERGLHVVVNDLDEDAAERGAASLRDRGLAATAVPFDVADADAVNAGVTRVAAEVGAVRVLVNNAAWISNQSSLTDMSLDSWHRELSINLTGPFLCTRAVLPGMYEAGAGRIVNMSSVAALRGMYGACGYASTKAGLLGLTRTVALEGARRGVTCNAVSPGPIDKPEGSEVRPDIRDAMRRRVPGGDFGTPESVAGLVGYLACDADPYLTGQCIALDGGAGLYHLDLSGPAPSS